MGKHKCTVSEDGQHVEPCDALAHETEYGNPHPRKRGIFSWAYRDMRTGKPSRTFFGAVTTHSPKGFLFNFCPYCGEQIDSPFARDDEDTE